MADPSGLRPEDRADFEAVLHLALATPDIRHIRHALRADPTGRAAATHLRLRALTEADEITAAADGEYHTYLTCFAMNASADQTTPRRPADAGPVATLAVLTPSVATSSAAALVLGYLLQLTNVRGALPGSLIAAGWILAPVAALSALIALAALLGTAIRGRGSSVPLRPAGAGTAGLAAGPAGARLAPPPAPADRRGSAPPPGAAHCHARHRFQERPSAHPLAAAPVRAAEQTAPDSSIHSVEPEGETRPCRST
ncbi:hypothetical protein [Streptomyces sp. 2A115]|uniref:hypothetical protein n=1 Tax=Streptomyces sp. 2A115 TaxID=3457439 RepID=UPI003FCF796E